MLCCNKKNQTVARLQNWERAKQDRRFGLAWKRQQMFSCPRLFGQTGEWCIMPRLGAPLQGSLLFRPNYSSHAQTGPRSELTRLCAADIQNHSRQTGENVVVTSPGFNPPRPIPSPPSSLTHSTCVCFTAYMALALSNSGVATSIWEERKTMMAGYYIAYKMNGATGGVKVVQLWWQPLKRQFS